MNPGPPPAGSHRFRLRHLLRMMPKPPGGSLLLLGEAAPLMAGVMPGERWHSNSDPEDLDLPSDHFALVVAMDHFERVQWGRWSFQEIHRILAPGGQLVFTVANPSGLAWRLKRRLAGSPDTGGGAHFFLSFHTLFKLTGMLEQLGFQIQQLETHGWHLTMNNLWINKLFFPVTGMMELAEPFFRGTFLSGLGNQAFLVCGKPEVGSERFQPVPGVAADVLEQVVTKLYGEALAERQRWLARYRGDVGGMVTVAFQEPEPWGDVLVISPHPDDELIGCGGMLLRLLEEGRRAVILQLTDGGAAAALEKAPESVRGTVRFAEASQVADAMGAALICWPIPGMGLTASAENVAKLAEILTSRHFSHIFIPFLNDPHSDHRVANHVLAGALAQMGDMAASRVYGYEVWSFAPANYCCPIDRQMTDKCNLLMRYRTGMKSVDYVRHCRLINAYHGRNLLGIDGYAEAFFRSDVPGYLRLVALEKGS